MSDVIADIVVLLMFLQSSFSRASSVTTEFSIIIVYMCVHVVTFSQLNMRNLRQLFLPNRPGKY